MGAADGIALSVGLGDVVGENDHGDAEQRGVESSLSKHSHAAGDCVKSHLPRPAQLAGHIDLRVAFVKEWQSFVVSRRICEVVEILARE